jgi:hypothetical protein
MGGRFFPRNDATAVSSTAVCPIVESMKRNAPVSYSGTALQRDGFELVSACFFAVGSTGGGG